MTCDEARDRLSAVLDDALDADERARVEAHLEGCAECRRELLQLRRTVALVRTLGPARAPAGFVDRVLEAAQPVPWHRRALRRLFWPLPVKLPLEVAALVLVGVTALYVYQRSPELQEAARVEAPVASRPATPATPSPAAPPAATPPAVATTPSPTPSPPPPSASPGSSVSPPARPEAWSSQASPPSGEPKTGKREETQVFGAAKEASPSADYRKDAAGRDADRSPPPAAPAPTESEAGASATRRGTLQPPTAESGAGAVASKPEGGAKRLGSEEAARAKAAPEPAAPAELETSRAAQARPSLAVAPPPDVSGRLAVRDRDAALRALGELAGRLGATQVSRPPAPGRQSAEGVDIVVPRGAYAALVDGLTRIGEWRPDREPAELPGEIRVTVRFAEELGGGLRPPSEPPGRLPRRSRGSEWKGARRHGGSLRELLGAAPV